MTPFAEHSSDSGSLATWRTELLTRRECRPSSWQVEARRAMRQAAADERARQRQEKALGKQPPQLVEEMLNAGYRALAKKAHPDTATGSHEAMQRLTEAKEDARRALERAGLIRRAPRQKRGAK